MFDPDDDYLDEFREQLDEANFQRAVDEAVEATLRASGYGIANLRDLLGTR